MDEVREFTAPSRLLNQPLLSFLLLTALYVSYGLLAGLSTQIISPAASSAWLCSVGTDGGWDGWVLCLEEHRQGHRPIYNIPYIIFSFLNLMPKYVTTSFHINILFTSAVLLLRTELKEV